MLFIDVLLVVLFSTGPLLPHALFLFPACGHTTGPHSIRRVRTTHRFLRSNAPPVGLYNVGEKTL